MIFNLKYNNQLFMINHYAGGSIIIWREKNKYGYFEDEIQDINLVDSFKLKEIVENISLYREVLDKYKALMNLL